MNLPLDLGVQSYCFRHFTDNNEVARLVRECGLDKIEICAVHVDFSKPETFEEVIEAYREAGVQIVSMGVQYFSDDEARERNFFEFARLAGARHISATFGIDTVPHSCRTAEKLADEYDIRLAIHNHGGRDWLGSAAQLGHTLANTSDRVGLCLDTAWALDSGENPLEVAEKFADRLYGAHIKDFVFDRARKPEDVVVGTGGLDLPAFVKQLINNPAVGYTVLEYEGDVENPVPALKQCVAAVHAATA